MSDSLKVRIKNKALRTLFKVFRKTNLPYKTNRILIVRLDAIGDYVLFRNYLHQLKNAPAFQKFKITLLGNEIFKDLAEEFDSHVIDEFIWISPSVDLYNPNQRAELAMGLKMKAFDILINPVHSKVADIEQLINELGAKKKICSSGDTINLTSPEQLKKLNQVYDVVVPVPGTHCFEYLRNREFIQLITNTTDAPALTFKIEAKKQKNGLQVVIFPGAGQAYRQWGTRHFADVVNNIASALKDKVRVIIAGSDADKALANEIISLIDNKAIIEDKTGQTSLTQLVYLIHHSNLLIANDTSAIHIAAAVKTKAICLSNGNHFGRFNPYPPEISKDVYTFYPDKEFYEPERYQALNELYKYSSTLPMDSIDAKKVADKALEILGANITAVKKKNAV